MSTPGTLLTVLGLMTAVAFVGGMIGLFIGCGMSNRDKFIYADTVQHGEILMRANIDVRVPPEPGRS